MGQRLRVAVELLVEDGRVVRRRLPPDAPGAVVARDVVTLASSLAALGADAIAFHDVGALAAGRPLQLELVTRLAAECACEVHYRGGVSTPDHVEAVRRAGVAKILLDTATFGDPAFLRFALDALGTRLVVALDADGSRVRVPFEAGPLSLVDAAAELAYRGVAAFAYTDRARAGTLAGPNLAALGSLCDAVAAPVTYGGGVATLDDVRSLARLRRPSLRGIMLGTALWEQRFTLAEAIEAVGGRTERKDTT